WPGPSSWLSLTFWACVAERDFPSLSELVASARQGSPVTLKSSVLRRQLLAERGLARGLDQIIF
ncbi:hypothetical protein A2U01_0073994, partial [Trifolium medium]|nr:hypothetical protein [Trifolium medium]